MKFDSATPIPLDDSALDVRHTADVESTVVRPSSFYAGVSRRARPYDVDHYLGLRQTDGLLDASRFFAYRNPGPTETDVRLLENKACRRAVGPGPIVEITELAAESSFLPRGLTFILDIPFSDVKRRKYMHAKSLKCYRNLGRLSNGPLRSLCTRCACLILMIPPGSAARESIGPNTGTEIVTLNFRSVLTRLPPFSLAGRVVDIKPA